MKVYVPFDASEFDGCSEPLGAFSTEEAAIAAYKKCFDYEGPEFRSLAVAELELDALLDYN